MVLANHFKKYMYMYTQTCLHDLLWCGYFLDHFRDLVLIFRQLGCPKLLHDLAMRLSSDVKHVYELSSEGVVCRHALPNARHMPLPKHGDHQKQKLLQFSDEEADGIISHLNSTPHPPSKNANQTGNHYSLTDSPLSYQWAHSQGYTNTIKIQ